MNHRFTRQGILAGICAFGVLAGSASAALAASKRYVNVVNGTTQAIGVTFTGGSAVKPLAEGTVEKFNSKSFAMADEFVTVKIAYVKGCTGSVTRDVPLGKNITVREGCDIEIK